MNRIKIAYFDIDGALVDFYAGQSAPQILEPLPRLQQAGKGKIVCLATGRAPMVLPRFSGIGFDTLVLGRSKPSKVLRSFRIHDSIVCWPVQDRCPAIGRRRATARTAAGSQTQAHGRRQDQGSEFLQSVHLLYHNKRTQLRVTTHSRL